MHFNLFFKKLKLKPNISLQRKLYWVGGGVGTEGGGEGKRGQRELEGEVERFLI